MKFIKIGERYINVDQITFIEPGGVGGRDIEVKFSSYLMLSGKDGEEFKKWMRDNLPPTLPLKP